MAITSTELTQANRAQGTNDHLVTSSDPEAIRLQIQRTRSRMGVTIDEIQKRLSPDYIKEQATETLREAASDRVEQFTQTAEDTMNSWRMNAMNTIKDNPVPAALIGIGLGWLLLSERNRDDEYDFDYEYDRTYYGNRPVGPYGYTGESRYGWTGDRPSRMRSRYEVDYDEERELMGMVDDAQGWVEDTAEMAQRKAERAANAAQRKAQQAASAVSGQASDMASSVRRTVSETSDSAQHHASDFADEAQRMAADARMQARLTAEQAQREFNYRMRQTKKTFWNTMEENPMAIGIAALAAGALVGLVIPGTQRENELMGERRDQLLEEAGQTVQQTVRKAQTVAERTAETAMAEAKRQAEQQNLTLSGESSKGTNGGTRSTGSQTTAPSSTGQKTTPASKTTNKS